MASNKAKSFRRRGDSSDEEEGEDSGPALLRRPPTRPGGAGGCKKKAGVGSSSSSTSKLAGSGSSSSSLAGSGAGGAGAAAAAAAAASKKASMLSFEDDEDDGEEGAGGLQALKSKTKPKKKKVLASRSLEKAMQEMEGKTAAAGGDGPGAPSSFFASGAGSGGGGGEYTAEKLAALRKGQNFQVSTKPAKSAGKRVTFLAPDGSEDLLPPGHEEVADEELDKEEVAGLKREKRERWRREALAAGAEDGGAGAEGSGDEEGEDFIPLDGGQRLSKGERRLERAGLAGEQDVEVEDDWESEMIRRGVRKPSAAPAAAAAAASNGGALSSTLGRLGMGMGVGAGGGAGAPAFKTVEGVLRDLRTTKERVDEAHGKNERAAAQAQADLEGARAGCGKLQAEFDETAARFQFFQDTREYLSSLCGCLREKQGMVAELEAAVAQVRRDAAERRWARRVEDQEDALEELQARGQLRSLQGYRPTVVGGLLAGSEGSEQKPELDEFGRDRSVGEEATRARRRQARLARREKLLVRLRRSQSQQAPYGKEDAADTAEAEARLSGGEESESEAAQTRARRRKLLEAAGVIFEDAAEEFSAVDPVAARFELWKRKHPRDYQTAYVSAALPQVLEPLVRVEMAPWDPLALEVGGEEGEEGEEEVATALEGFAWYERLFAFGQGPEGEGAPPPPQQEDPDERLVPTLVEKVAVQLLQKLLAEAYDPLSGRETARAVAAVQAVLIYEPGKHAMEELLKAPLERLKQATRALCVPLLQPSAPAEAVAFQRRQIFRAVKLYANVGAWHEVLAPRALAPVALGELLEGALVPALADRLESSSSSSSSGAPTAPTAALEALGTLEALLTATPPALLLEKSAPTLTRTLEVLDRIGQQAGQAAPVVSTVKRLRAGFGGGGGSN